MKLKFDFNDITIVPEIISPIKNRSEISTKYSDGYLPLFTAPMDMVINEKNKNHYYNNKIRVVLPRGVKSNDPRDIVSVSLNEIEDLYNEDLINPNGSYLIDIANGHMEYLLNTVKLLKAEFPNMFLMVGNIANPKTYVELSNAGADAIRCGIGGGSHCTTSANLGVHYPMGSLISECYKLSCTLDNPAIIVADGGFKNYSDIVKALVLGADYVMIGGIFNKCIESSGDNYLFNLIRVNQNLANLCYQYGLPIHKKMRGMSTKEVQKVWGNAILKTSEGITTRKKVNTSLYKWTENFEDYLKSAMSYCGKRDLNSLIGKVKYVKITQNALKRFDK